MTSQWLRLIHDENLVGLGLLEAQCVRVDLAYLDPPFCTGGVFVMADGRIAYDDRWSSRAAWLDALKLRLEVVARLLAPHGSLVVHVDWRTAHLVRSLGDAIFGEEAFASEIIWRYRRWPTKTKNFQHVHDVLLRWRKDITVEPCWNQLYEPLAASTIATWGTRKQRAVTEGGRRKRSSVTSVESPGVPLGDVWDIGILAPVSRERTGYPTQKPEALLDRIIASLSNPGDIVLDPYAGSGTTLAVATRLGRRAIGIDASAVAIDVARTRLGLEAA